MLTTLIGQPVDELDTPALLIDLDAFEQNLAFLSGEVKTAGIGWRPHAKGHKCPAIAHKQIEAGALGVTCAKLGEAEVMAANGIRDILVANQVVGPIKTRRLAALCAHADVIVAVDSIENGREIAAAGKAHGTKPRVIVEVNVGMNRAGTEPGEATVALSQQLAELDGLLYVGLMGYEGHSMAVPDAGERTTSIETAVRSLVQSAEACKAAGLPVEIVSASGTGTFRSAVAISGITEVQAGGGIFGDIVYRDLGVPVQPALKLLVQVISRPTANRIILDSGRKTADPSSRMPAPQGIEGIKTIFFSAEHGTVTLDRDSELPRIGDRVELEVGYHDQTTHLHEALYGVRNGLVETIWPILGRGRLQ